MSTAAAANAPAGDVPAAADLASGREKDATSVPVSAPATTSTNPGSLEDLHRKCREVFPMCFDGARTMLTKAISSHFQVCSICCKEVSAKFLYTQLRDAGSP